MTVQTPLTTAPRRVVVAVAPNGGRKTKADHPALPVSADELARAAADCLDRGASMMHLHVRDQDGGHVLDAAAYRTVIARICQKVGDRLVLQITSELIGRYSPAEQRAVILQTNPEAVSLALRAIRATSRYAEGNALLPWASVGSESRWVCTTLPTSTTAAGSRASRGSTASPAHETICARDRDARQPRAPRRRGRGRRDRRRRGHPRPDPRRVPARGAGVRAAAGGRYAVAVCMLPREADRRSRGRDRDRAAGRRTAASGCSAGATCRSTRACPGRARWPSMPVIRQLLIGAARPTGDAFERRLYGIRRRAERGLGDAVAFPSFSSRTMVLKGMLSAPQLPRFYPDLCDPRFASALAIVHSRFSTNTFPSWALAHPFRFIAHNGEINTLRGNVNWMRAREHALGEFAEVRPVIPAGRVGLRELRRRARAARAGGAPARARGDDDGARRRGRAATTCPRTLRGLLRLPREADGAVGRAGVDHVLRRARCSARKLDRNGLRPGRWAQTDDGWVVLASETGAMPLEPARVDQARAAEAGRAVDRRPRARRAVRRPRGRVRDRVAAAVRDVGGRGDDPAARTSRRGDAAARAGGAARRAAARASATRARTSTS